ncbi:clathrin assembly protein-like [Dorcoceras hygrometricum]|uniref:Clathrin assembly protein-like n=1 Tax=Dorcoceras hygrometricum TaxID=472368 RepID=A0A2Z7B7Y0_9LAMI|nr:clathrin assembly protein-like [Dorcoceras hygrometricum]
MDSFRKAYGALKDSTKVGLAKVNSDFKDLDIAIVKATNHVERPPKERYVRKIFAAVSVSRPRADVAYCIHALSKRLSKTRNWIVAVKTLIVFHRTLREADPSFREEVLSYSKSGPLFQVSSFRDGSSALAWDCSAWIRTYGLFLEERLECFQTLNYDIESDIVPKSSVGESKGNNKTQILSAEELLRKLPALQQLLYRLVGCQPERAASYNFLIQYALALVLKESFRIYRAINDGIINLLETFFEMPKQDAVRALDIYKRAGKQAELLADFYSFCRTLDLARTFQFPTLTQASPQPPPSFLATMEDYVREAPQTSSVLSNKQLEQKKTEEVQKKPENPARKEVKEQVVDKKNKNETSEIFEPIKEKEILPKVSAEEPVDLLGFNEENPKAVDFNQSNALALAIVQPGNSTNKFSANLEKTSGWELALVTAPSSTSQPQVQETKMAGGFDKLLLDSLYDDEASRRQIQMHSAGYSTGQGYEFSPQNPFGLNDPLAMSNNVFAMRNMHDQQAMFHHQHHHHQQQHMMFDQQQQQHMTMVPYNPYAGHNYQQQIAHMGNPNPFGDHFYYPPNANGSHALL